MATYTFINKDHVDFVLGGKTGFFSSTAGMRLNSLWFKSFSLRPQFTTLPVKLTIFSAMKQEKGVMLSWSTAMEQDFSHFVLERSFNGKDFTDLVLVMTKGNTATGDNYNWLDRLTSPASGLVYYRLRLVENTGKSSFSDIRMIKFGTDAGALALQVFPNPTRSSVYLTLPAAWQGKQVGFRVVTMTGSTIISRSAGSASQTEVLDVDKIPDGFYLIEASCEGIIIRQKLMKK
jgi:hypothetical protein